MSVRSTHTSSRHATRPPGRSGSRRVVVRAASVSQLVRTAGRGLRALRWAEALLWSTAAILLTGAAAVESSGVDRDALVGDALRDLLVLGAVLGVVTFAVVLRAGWPTDAGIVRDLDRRLQRRFALVAAFERECADRPTEIDALLSARARADLSTSDAFTGHANGAIPAVVAPLVAAALLGMALGPIDRPRTDVVDLTQQVAGDLGAAVARNADGMAPEDQAALARIVRELEQVSRRMDLESSSEAARNLERLRDDLTERAAELDPSGELARGIEKALATLAAAERRARQGSGASESASPGERAVSRSDERAGDGRPGTDEGAGERANGADASSSSGSGGSESAADGDGGSESDADGGSDGDPNGVAAEAGGVRRDWLEPTERDLVEAWIERRRREGLGAGEEKESVGGAARDADSAPR